MEEILKLVDRGFPVIPLHTRSKNPLTKHAYKDASKNRDKITAWFTERPDANVGVVTGKVSGIVVIDVDGEEGKRTLAELERKHGQLPETLTAATDRGKHMYFRYPQGKTVPTAKLGPGLDLKSDGGYVVAPPSVHPNGTLYRWTNAAEIQPLPAWVLTKTKEKKVGKGDRHDALKKFACEVANQGATDDELRKAVQLYNQEKCKPAKPSTEVDAVVDWVLKNHVPTTDVRDYDLDWFQFSVKKFFGDTELMTLTDYQMGWWIRLQAFAWANKGVLPADSNKLCRLAHAEDAAVFKAEKDAVLFEYELVDGKLVNHKMAAHWQEKQELTKKRVKAGRARAEKNKKHDIADEQLAAAA